MSLSASLTHQTLNLNSTLSPSLNNLQTIDNLSTLFCLFLRKKTIKGHNNKKKQFQQQESVCIRT